MPQLIWFRTDLRTRDNTALAAAMAAGPTIALFLLSPGQWRLHDDADCKVDFWLRNLSELSRSLARLNVPLLVREIDRWDEAPQMLERLCLEQGIECVRVNEEYGVNEQRRDEAVAATLQARGIAFRSHLDQLLFAPGSVLTQAGRYFQVFGQFRKVCHARLRLSLPDRVPLPPAQAPLPLTSDAIPTQVAGFAQPSAGLRDLWPAGEDVAQERLRRFVDESIIDYHDTRDLPAIPGTSRLSPYLAAGVLSPRQCLHAALSANRGEFDGGNPGVVSWINELLWREFYTHILVGFPRVSMHRAFRPVTELLQWRRDDPDLEAWQQGQTGFPIVDAAMRQLLATGWMHNRLRMISAMFLTKNLLIDWREGERWFMRYLIDGDLAANNGGWQWSASTGTDAVPYFRLFNPINQSRNFDPEGRFLRHWLPELAGLGNRDIHDPTAHGGLFPLADYPRPIVDLAHSRERALATFKALEGLHAG